MKEHGRWGPMKILPAVSESDKLLSSIRRRAAMPTNFRRSTLTIKDVVTSTK